MRQLAIFCSSQLPDRVRDNNHPHRLLSSISVLLSPTATPALLRQCRVEQREHCLPMMFGGGGIIDLRIAEHPPVLCLMVLDPMIDTGLRQGLLQPLLHVIGESVILDGTRNIDP